MTARKPGAHPAHSATTTTADNPRLACPTDSAKSGTPRNPIPPQDIVDGARAGSRSNRLPDAKNLRWLKPYTRLGYTYARNSHLKVYDPTGLFVTTIGITPHDSEYRIAKAALRRHERCRKAK
jgi:hypothetical protein